MGFLWEIYNSLACNGNSADSRWISNGQTGYKAGKAEMKNIEQFDKGKRQKEKNI